MNRDELARHLYVNGYGGHLPWDQWDRDLAAKVWDDGEALASDVGDCLDRAEELIANGGGAVVSTAFMHELPAGARFIGPDGRTEYQVTTPAAEHPHGWVQVWNLSMTDAEAAVLSATPGAVEPGCDPRDGDFCYTVPVEVDVL